MVTVLFDDYAFMMFLEIFGSVKRYKKKFKVQNPDWSIIWFWHTPGIVYATVTFTPIFKWLLLRPKMYFEMYYKLIDIWMQKNAEVQGFGGFAM